MKKLTVVLLFAVFALAAGLLAVTNDPKDEKAVMQTLETMAEATKKKDLPTLGKVYHDDLTYSHSSAMNETKAQVLKAVSGTGVVESIKFSDANIRIYGNTALVRCTTDMRNGASMDKLNNNHLNILWVMVKGAGPHGWQIVARQTTRYPAAQ
jgi:ketosteroid isomerase-like protein